ncbi:MAG: hypothetical protein H6558_19635 [Lewinellaceae bacterium]|nr:hypothetical protein [Lewinellaceae bacterium]
MKCKRELPPGRSRWRAPPHRWDWTDAFPIPRLQHKLAQGLSGYYGARVA